MHALIALVIGLLAGAHASTWGMYKDAIHEGFTYRKYFRSIVVGGLLGVVLEAIVAFDLTRPASIVVFFGLVYAAERGVVEVWKTFFRSEDQSKYFIPMQFHIGGRVVASRGARIAVGLAYVAVVMLVLAGIWALERSGVTDAAPRLLVVLLVASVGGWVSAFGGAWKDAPLEGFELLKFFRSPLMTAAWGALLAVFTDNLVYIAVAALGYERATIETYKTFFFPSKPRGKFAGKPILYPEMLERRKRYVPLYVLVWVGVLVAIGMAASRA